MRMIQKKDKADYVHKSYKIELCHSNKKVKNYDSEGQKK